MKMEYRAEILRGWPADGARERLELIKPGATLQNGDFVQMQADGTVDKSDSTKRARVGLVVRGNLDNALVVGGTTYPNSSQLASGRVATTAYTATTIGTSAVYADTGVVTVTHSSAHGLLTGNTVTISGCAILGGSNTTTTNPLNGTFIVNVTSSTVFTYTTVSGLLTSAVFGNSGTVSTLGTFLKGTIVTGGKAIVLWGNYIARLKSDTYTATNMTVGGAVCAVSGKLVAAVGSGAMATFNGDAPATTFTGQLDPELGFILRIEGAAASHPTEESHIVISVR